MKCRYVVLMPYLCGRCKYESLDRSEFMDHVQGCMGNFWEVLDTENA
jgi:hypothetical protein